MKFTLLLVAVVTVAAASAHPDPLNWKAGGIQGTGQCRPDWRCRTCYDYIPHETDCTLFYKCDCGMRACLMNCPAGLHWNRIKNYCDWPSEARCYV
jgi:hypothetical protein